MVDILNNFAEYCNYQEEEYNCGLALSLDPYHYLIPERNIEKYKQLRFYSSNKEQRKITYIINEGRAAENHIGHRNIDMTNNAFEIEEIGDDIYVRDNIYINVKGDVLTNCDLSYESQIKYKLGNVLKEPLKDIILRNCKEV
jgi:hypothetical protein